MGLNQVWKILLALYFIALTPSFAAPLLTGSVTNAATVDVDFSSIVSSYRKIHVYIYDVVVETDGACVDMMTSSSGGSTWDNSVSDYYWAFLELYDDTTTIYHASSVSHGNLDFQYRLSTSLGNSAGQSGTFEVTFHNPAGTTLNKLIEHTGGHAFIDGIITSYKGSGMRRSTSIINAVRFRAANNNNTGATKGNISASWAVYGE